MNVLKEIINSINEKISDRLMYKNEKIKGKESVIYERKGSTFLKISKIKAYDKNYTLKTYFAIEIYDNKNNHKYLKLSKTEAKLLYVVLRNFMEGKRLHENLDIDDVECGIGEVDNNEVHVW